VSLVQGVDTVLVLLLCLVIISVQLTDVSGRTVPGSFPFVRTAPALLTEETICHRMELEGMMITMSL
jgi:hypothetical protein